LIRPFNPTYGPEDAPVTIIEFSDFQCPFCKRFHDTTRGEILRKYQGKVRFVYKHFPLEQIHPSARDAAIASQCAFRVGKFWELHDRIFEKQRDLSKEALLQWGKELALPANYTVCLTKQETSAEVDQDFKDGLEVGVRGTPTFLINGRILSGALPFPFFQKEIERYL
jgi:protein-disulfide isomerase